MAEEESKIKAIIFDIGGVLALDAPKYFMGELSIKRDTSFVLFSHPGS